MVDDLGRSLQFEAAPRRIVTLVPTAAEILFALGEGDRMVGRSRYADYPRGVLAVPSVGDAIRPSTELVLARRPDVVVMVAGADNRRAVDELGRLGVQTLAIRINTFDDLERNIRRLGVMTGAESAAGALISDIRAELAEVEVATRGLESPTVYYDVGFPPAYTIGGGSYLDRLITIAGGRNVFGDLEVPASQVSLEAIAGRDPDLIVFPIRPDASPSTRPADRPGWTALRAVESGSVRTVDVDLLSRLGPRIGRAARSLAVAIHPELIDRWPDAGTRSP